MKHGYYVQQALIISIAAWAIVNVLAGFPVGRVAYVVVIVALFGAFALIRWQETRLSHVEPVETDGSGFGSYTASTTFERDLRVVRVTTRHAGRFVGSVYGVDAPAFEVWSGYSMTVQSVKPFDSVRLETEDGEAVTIETPEGLICERYR